MYQKILRSFRIIQAVVHKDLQDIYRFKFLFTTRFFTPVLNMLSFYFLYRAVFSNIKSVGYVHKDNYVLYLVTGFLAYNFFRMAWNSTRLIQEKYMLTLEGTLLAPVSRLYILVGKGVRAFLELLIDTFIFSILLLFLHPPVSLFGLILAIISLLCLYSIWISIDFVITGIQLSQEGVASFLAEYIPRGVMLISAVYYPIESLPFFFREISFLNPVYHAVILFRNAFMMNLSGQQAWISFGYLLILGIIFPPVSVMIFDYIFKKFGIKGY